MADNSLKKEISFSGALSTVMGTVIGAGVFFKAAAVVSHTQSAGLTLFAWLFAGFLTICGGLTVAELATAIPKTGGPIRYIEETYGKLPSFLLGWAQTIIYFPANIAALSIIFATQFTHLFQLNDRILVPLAMITAVSVTGINLLGTKIASNVQSLTLFIKLLPILVIVVAGLIQPGQVEVGITDLSIGGDNSWAQGFSAALLATLFAYDGWLNVGNIAGEMKHPEKDLPKAIILGLGSVTVVYWVINFVYLKTLPAEQIAGNLNASSDVAYNLFGNMGGKIVTLGILISVYGALNGYTMTGSRVSFALALNDEFPFSKYFKKISNKTKIPYISVIVQLVIACIMMTLGTFDVLTDMLIFVMWSFSMLLFLAVFILRKRAPDMPRPYKVPLYPIVPLIAMLGGGFILIMTLITTPGLAFTGIGVTAIGVPIYFYMKKKK
ncbi:APC family permease [Tetragenococcus muriaticus]|uniref:Amino acid permease family protein n=2 Tax=Tetragenococcus muriaticus TaxID=64642 RepID=A0A091C7M7_9ENTE|nr:amino acid permease [Tetragenococcus muriaticus]KFN92695.1 amino acid permease family protein [Tetragenococcus muriaticus 3MR10-3]KFN93363.1 amino acid permease family protein [Tetragenococcus muriaticus PMC-11-5]GMA45985.1 amino acid permease [Tetragenococcus muriaticus]GMA46067.1 amino acid permease [Tetragenococcus muriaticus]GMA46226.1 amino acid permease [Tetragenococcus muriaticus]